MFKAYTYTHTSRELKEMHNLLRESYDHNEVPSNWFFSRFENWHYAHNYNIDKRDIDNLSDKIRLWRNYDGKLVAFCISEYSKGDYYIQVHRKYREVEDEVIQWIIDNTTGMIKIYAFEEDTYRIEKLKSYGFQCEGHIGNIYAYDLSKILYQKHLADGFRASTLAELEDFHTFFEAKDAAFPHAGSSKERFINKSRAPGYYYEWNIITMSPDERCASFCTAWPDFQCNMAEIDPVGTHPDFQQKGLAKAMLVETFQRLKKAGIEMAYIGTGAEPFPANYIYKSLEPIHKFKELSFIKED
ncbi:MAG: GNAT family N-acetyltransferase [Halanaerobiales bacterium]|nr:GNAT family N-acetyltransferase [Halanaerobiales bacterium]